MTRPSKTSGKASPHAEDERSGQAKKRRRRERRLLGSQVLGDRFAYIRLSLARLSRSKRFLPWSKKRGSRIVGGRLTGVAGEAAFFALLFLVGAPLLITPELTAWPSRESKL